jgi:hypothetical protein
MPATVNANNVALGVGDLYTAPKDTVQPTDALIISNAIPTPWVFVGATKEGFTLTYSQTTVEIDIEEQSLPVNTLKSTTKFEIGGSLSEDTMPNMALAYSGVLTAIAAGSVGSGIAAKTLVQLTDTLGMVAVCMRLINPAGFARLVYIPRVVQGGNVATAMRRVAEQRLYPVTFSATPVHTSDIQILDFPSATPPP